VRRKNELLELLHVNGGKKGAAVMNTAQTLTALYLAFCGGAIFGFVLGTLLAQRHQALISIYLPGTDSRKNNIYFRAESDSVVTLVTASVTHFHHTS